MKPLSLLAGFCLLAAACTYNPPRAPAVTPDSSGVSPVRGTYTMSTILRPIVGLISGEATITGSVNSGQLQATISLTGSDAGRQHPWHIHRGRCDLQDIATVGSITLYRNLDVRADGHAALTQKVAVELDPYAAYYVDVHLSQSRMEALIACGDLARR